MMKRWLTPLSLALFTLWLPGQAVAQNPAPETSATSDENAPAYREVGQLVRVFSDGELKADEECNEVTILFGSGNVLGRVRREVRNFFGSLHIDGTVERNVVVGFGNLTLGSNAVVNGQIVLIGADLESHPDAQLARAPIEYGRFGDYPVVAEFGQWLRQGLLLGRPLPPGVTWVWWVAGVFLLMYLVTLVLFPKPVEACAQVLEQRPVGCFFTGLLVEILLAPVVALLVATGLGILVVPFVFLAWLGAILLGKTAVLQFTGRQLGRQINATLAQRPLVTLLLGAALFSLLYMIPVLGFIAWGAALLMGVGAATLAAAGSLRRESGSAATRDPGPPPVRLRPAGAAGSVGEPPVLDAGEELALPRVGFWRRLLALALDAFLFLCLLFLISLPFGRQLPGVMPFLLMLLWGAYHIGLWAWKGTTIGGIVMGLKLVREDGRPVDVAVAVVRALSSLFSAMALGLGFFWAGWSRDKCAWHDRIAGTVIVKFPRGMPLL